MTSSYFFFIEKNMEKVTTQSNNRKPDPNDPIGNIVYDLLWRAATLIDGIRVPLPLIAGPPLIIYKLIEPSANSWQQAAVPAACATAMVVLALAAGSFFLDKQKTSTENEPVLLPLLATTVSTVGYVVLGASHVFPGGEVVGFLGACSNLANLSLQNCVETLRYLALDPSIRHLGRD
ncbi:MAG: hypothetical protein ACK5WY_04190 [Holosporaceae bacterium]